jgi:hypothetical protein
VIPPLPALEITNISSENMSRIGRMNPKIYTLACVLVDMIAKYFSSTHHCCLTFGKSATINEFMIHAKPPVVIIGHPYKAHMGMKVSTKAWFGSKLISSDTFPSSEGRLGAGSCDSSFSARIS